MKRFIFLIFFGLLAFAADAQRGYGFPAQDLRNPPDTGMIMITNPWPTGAKTVAAFWQYKSLIPGWGGGGSVDLSGIRDSLDYLYGQTAQPDTAQQVVYKPAHGQNPDLCPGGILPLTENFDAATAANAEDLPFTYAIGTRGPDSLVIKASGFYTSTAHGLTIGQVYYQQDSPCDLETTPGTISAAVLLVIDANTIQLIDRSGLPGSDAVRIWIPSSQFTSRGDDPAAPRDSTVGAIALQYQSVGLARPGAIFVYQLPAGTNNPTYTAPSGESSTPARAWFWDGTRATRIADAVIAVDMSATSVGGRALVPASNGTAAEAIQYISDNYENLNLPNGTVLYWKGSGTDVNPDTAYVVIDNPTIVGGQQVMLVKSLAADQNGIISALPLGSVTINGASNSVLEINNSSLKIPFIYIDGSKPTLWADAGLYLERRVDIPSGGFHVGAVDLSSVYLATGFRGYANYTATAYTYSPTPITPAGDAYVAGFSSLPIYDNQGGGTLPFMYGHYSAMSGTLSSPINRAFDFYANELNAVNRVSGLPTVNTHFNFFAPNNTKATNNYGVFIEGSQGNYFAGQVGVGTLNTLNGLSNPHASAKLEVRSSTQGFLLPRMTANGVTAISSPAEGLMAYSTDSNGTITSKGWWGYDGATWKKIDNNTFSGLATGTTDASGDITVSLGFTAPDLTYSVVVTNEVDASWNNRVHSKTNVSFKIRTYESVTGVALPAGNTVSYSWIQKDY